MNGPTDPSGHPDADAMVTVPPPVEAMLPVIVVEAAFPACW